MARPSDYNQEIADEICAIISSTSKSLRTICLEDRFPSVVTIFAWFRKNEEFLKQYTRAKEEQADLLIEEMLDISDDGSNDFMKVVKGDAEYEIENKEWTSRSKLRVETRKWIASKLKPKKYGEKVEHSGNINLTNEPVKFE